MIRVAKEDESKYICMVTKKGVIKRSELEEYRNVRRKGVIAINLDEGDELAYVLLTSGEDNLLVATRQGMCIGFKETDARAIGRTGRGVKAITLKEGDEVVGMTLLREGGKILTVSEKGYGRRSLSEDYRIQIRGGLGVINYKTDRFGLVCAVREVRTMRM